MSDDWKEDDPGRPRQPSAIAQMMQPFEKWAHPMMEGQQLSSTDERHLAERLRQLQAAWEAEAEQEEPQYREAAIARWAKAREQSEATIAQMQAGMSARHSPIPSNCSV